MANKDNKWNNASRERVVLNQHPIHHFLPLNHMANIIMNVVWLRSVGMQYGNMYAYPMQSTNRYTTNLTQKNY